jgi:molybdenum cofactor cytidylyltransferase
MEIKTALRLGPAPRLALVGAGGKTTALFRLAREFAGPVLVATTTHLAVAQAALADHHLIVTSPANLVEQLRPLLVAAGAGAPQPRPAPRPAAPPSAPPVAAGQFDPVPDAFEPPPPARRAAQVLLVTAPATFDGRLVGLAPATLAELHALAEAYRLPLLIEADGSRLHPLKAPDEHEPVIPDFCAAVVVVAGLTGLGQPLGATWVHRPEQFKALSGLPAGAPITPPALARVLAHARGGLKNIPAGARRSLLFNQAATPFLQAAGAELARALVPPFHSAIVAELIPQALEAQVYLVHEPVAGVLLAAGGAARFGRPKQLLDWYGQPFVRHVAEMGLQAGLSPLVVVVGHAAEAVGAALAGLPVQLVANPAWAAGQGSSVRAGVAALPAETGAALFLLADQPQAPSTLVQALVAEHAQTMAPIVAPLVAGQRSNPVLFDRQTFPDLLALQGDAGGRALFARYPVDWLPWHDARLLLDVDTPADYARLLEAE